jgi:hypothetical protein
MAYNPSSSFFSVASSVRTVSGFLAQKLRGHFVIHLAEQAHGRVLLAQPVGEGNRPIKDGVPIAVAEQARDGFARLPALLLLGLILRFTDMIDGLQRPIDLSPP